MDISQIIAKKIKGGLSEAEQDYLDSWINESEENGSLFYRLLDSGVREDIFEISRLDDDAHWQKVLERSNKKGSKTDKAFQLKYLFRYAAIFIGAIGLVYGYWQSTTGDKDSFEIEDVITLQLENGEVRTLSPERATTISNSQGVILGEQKGNRLDYSNRTKTEKLVFNTLTVPNGTKFSVMLSDSTLVHLNAGSSLRYPVKFIKDQNRQVFLTGEGYFDVSKDTEHPFVVTSGTMDVRVLGTKFNITAYPEDREINTVLVEGSVSLYSSESDYDPQKADILLPGYKAAWDRFYEKMEVEKVDTDIYTGWIDGKLVIKNMSFKNIVYKLERHYNVSIDNTYEALSNEIFTATFDIETIEDALRIFTEETPFEYEFKRDRITIYEPNTIQLK